MSLGPVQRRSQTEFDPWFYTEPEEEPYFQSDTLSYANPETKAVGKWVVEDPKYSKSMSKWVRKRFQKTYDADTIHDDLITKFMDNILNGANKLEMPYKNLVLQSLENVDWDQLASFYTYQLGKSPEETHLDEAINMLPDDEELLPDFDFDFDQDEDVPIRTRPNIKYEEQQPHFQPTYTQFQPA